MPQLNRDAPAAPRMFQLSQDAPAAQDAQLSQDAPAAPRMSQLAHAAEMVIPLPSSGHQRNFPNAPVHRPKIWVLTGFLPSPSLNMRELESH